MLDYMNGAASYEIPDFVRNEFADCQDDMDQQDATIASLRERVAQLERGVSWALGESPEGTPEWPEFTKASPLFYWRLTLRELTRTASDKEGAK